MEIEIVVVGTVAPAGMLWSTRNHSSRHTYKHGTGKFWHSNHKLVSFTDTTAQGEGGPSISLFQRRASRDVVEIDEVYVRVRKTIRNKTIWTPPQPDTKEEYWKGWIQLNGEWKSTVEAGVVDQVVQDKLKGR